MAPLPSWTPLVPPLLDLLFVSFALIGGRRRARNDAPSPLQPAPAATIVRARPDPQLPRLPILRALPRPVGRWLTTLDGKRAYPLRSGRLLVGRARDCGLTIDDPHVSQHHCELRVDKRSCRIVDLGSTNGLFVNDVRVRVHDLVHGDVVRVGHFGLRYKSFR